LSVFTVDGAALRLKRFDALVQTVAHAAPVTSLEFLNVKCPADYYDANDGNPKET
jgi:hypothetical protein